MGAVCIMHSDPTDDLLQETEARAASHIPLLPTIRLLMSSQWLQDVAWVCFMTRFKKKEAMKRRLKDETYLTSLKESIIIAERALLYALGFEFTQTNPHRLAINMVRFMIVREQRLLLYNVQTAWNTRCGSL